jgi:hypothetical protein
MYSNIHKGILSLVAFIAIIFVYCNPEQSSNPIKFPNISGIYPHLAYYNSQGECGTGAVVPWADRLWAITYSPHFPNGSDDRLYEIDQDLNQVIRAESIGGTPANRMIHKESQQLFIGPYTIDNQRNVRAIPYEIMKGRHTGNARHLFDPVNKIYFATMEEGFYEVEVQSLDVVTLHKDGNVLRESGESQQLGPLLPGAHGKGLYSGQGVLVYANNGEYNQAAMQDFDVESGSLMEWDGKEWRLIRRNQFCEVTGPGGIYGNENPETDPIWTTGFDHKSLLLGIRDKGSWSFFRLPKASHTYDGAHGWNTEWPRIRDVGSEENSDYLMTMHGMFWEFPGDFTIDHPLGIRPRSAYLKVIGDFTRWKDQLVFGCDDSAQREFLNKRSVKGGIEGPGQSNSNLWFTSLTKPDELGPATVSGAVWLEEQINADEYSGPFLFAGWETKNLWLKNHGNQTNHFSIEVYADEGWRRSKELSVKPQESTLVQFKEEDIGEWIRAKSDADTRATLAFTYENKDRRDTQPDAMFHGLASVDDNDALGGLLYGLGNNRRKLGISSRDMNGHVAEYYELDSLLNLVSVNDKSTQRFIEEKFAIPENVITIEESSVLIIDDSGRRWRLPKGNQKYDDLIENAQLRICREVATERDLFNCHGTFYELPAENADGFAKIRPIASHNFRIHDYASYRGLLVMTGIDAAAEENPHIIMSDNKNAAVWIGVIDDLWQLGKPTGDGGPWKNTKVTAGISSDPYLIGFYDQKTLNLNHNLDKKVHFTLEVNPIGHGPWFKYKTFRVDPGEDLKFQFPDGFQARWVRLITDKACEATAWFVYN